MALHDLNLAAKYCDALVVLAEGRVRAVGRAVDVLTAYLVADVFGVEAQIELRAAVPQVWFTGIGQPSR